MYQIGRVGDSSVLDTAIGRVAGDPKKVHHSVTLRLMELGVKMSSNDTGDAVLHYTYPEVCRLIGCVTPESTHVASSRNLAWLFTRLDKWVGWTSIWEVRQHQMGR